MYEHRANVSALAASAHATTAREDSVHETGKAEGQLEGSWHACGAPGSEPSDPGERWLARVAAPYPASFFEYTLFLCS